MIWEKKSRQKFHRDENKMRKIVHNSGSRPSPGMIPGAKLIILTKDKFTKPQNCPGRPGGPKKFVRKNSKNAKIGQNLGGGP